MKFISVMFRNCSDIFIQKYTRIDKAKKRSKVLDNLKIIKTIRGLKEQTRKKHMTSKIRYLDMRENLCIFSS